MTAEQRLAVLLRERGDHPGGTLYCHLARVQEFVDLSLVNELDVAEHPPGFVEEYGGYFPRLTDQSTPVLQPAVATEVRRVFGPGTR